MQCLFATKPFAKCLATSKGPETFSLVAKVYDNYRKKANPSCAEIVHKMVAMKTGFREGEMADAFELFNTLLGLIQDEFLRDKIASPLDPIFSSCRLNKSNAQ